MASYVSRAIYPRRVPWRWGGGKVKELRPGRVTVSNTECSYRHEIRTRGLRWLSRRGPDVQYARAKSMLVLVPVLLQVLVRVRVELGAVQNVDMTDLLRGGSPEPHSAAN